MVTEKNSRYLLFTFAILFGWILALPYEGPVLFALGAEENVNATLLRTMTVLCYFTGLLAGRFVAANLPDAKRTILLGTGGTLVLSLFIPISPSDYWLFILPAVSFLMGAVLSGFAHLIIAYVPLAERSLFGADMLIYGHIFLAVSHAFTLVTPTRIAFMLIEILLLIAFVQFLRVDLNKPPIPSAISDKEKIPLQKFTIFFVFIFIISINSGIMFQVIYPYFSTYLQVSGLYTHLPYIVTLYLLARQVGKNKLNYLFLGLGMWGTTFILFSFINDSEPAFILISTLMLSAAAIFDYYWWSVMAGNFENVPNPSSLFGLGLSINVLGVWVGGILARHLTRIGYGHLELSYVGLSVVFLSMMIVLPLNQRLTAFLQSNEFMVRYSEVGIQERSTYRDEAKNLLSDREYQVFCLLLEGKTDPEISDQLSISLSTTKTHDRKIYRKLQVSGRQEILEKAGI